MERVLTLAIPFIAGVAVSFINYLVSRAALRRNKDSALIFPLRTVFAAGFLILVYFVSKSLALSVNACLISGALGVTVGITVFTMILIKNDRGGDDNG